MAKKPKGSPASAESAKKRMSEALTRAAESLDVPHSIRVFKSSNGDVDGELILHGFRRNQSLKEIADEVLHSFPRKLPGLWVSTGVRYAAPEGVKSPDYRFRGLAEAMSYYREGNPTGIFSAFVVESNILDNLRRRRRERPEQLIVRLHWNKDYQHPGRMPERHRRTFPKKGGKK